MKFIFQMVHNLRTIQTSFDIESQMTIDVVSLKQFRIYGTRVQKVSHVLG